VRHGVLVEGHSKPLYGLKLAVVDHLSGRSGYDMLFAIKMLHFQSDTSECLKESNFLDKDKISASALEGIMFFYFDANVDIASNDARLNKANLTYSSFYPVKI
jgi:hypothetical protein